MIERGDHPRLVLSEILLDLRSHVVGDDRYPILRLQRLCEAVSVVEHVVNEAVIRGSKLHQQYRGDGRLCLLEVSYLLRHAVFADAEVIFLQAGNKFATVRGDQHGHVH